MISTIDKAMFLKQVDIFASVRTEELLQIAEIANEVCFTQGHIIFSEGDPGDSLYFIIQGRVELQQDGKARATVLEKGSIGSYALLTEHPRYLTAVALTDTCALRISATDFMDLLSDNNQLALMMLRDLALKIIERSV